MWEYIEPLIDNTNLWQGEASVEQCVTARLQEYDGTIFFCCSLSDTERISTISRAAEAAGRQVRDVRRCSEDAAPQALGEVKGKQEIFGRRSQKKCLRE